MSKFSFLVLDLLLSFLFLYLFSLQFFYQFDMLLCFGSLKFFLFCNFLFNFFNLLLFNLLFLFMLYFFSLFLFHLNKLLDLFCFIIIFGVGLFLENLFGFGNMDRILNKVNFHFKLTNFRGYLPLFQFYKVYLT